MLLWPDGHKKPVGWPKEKMRTTNIIKAEYNYPQMKVRKEKLLTLQEFIEFGRLKVGQAILIGELSGEGNSFNTETIWIGHGTPFVEPSTNNGGIGWNFSSIQCNKFVLEVMEH